MLDAFQDSNGSLSSRKEVDYGKFYTSSYLEKSSGSYKRGPSINPPAGTKSPHFHRPGGCPCHPYCHTNSVTL